MIISSPQTPRFAEESNQVEASVTEISSILARHAGEGQEIARTINEISAMTTGNDREVQDMLLETTRMATVSTALKSAVSRFRY